AHAAPADGRVEITDELGLRARTDERAPARRGEDVVATRDLGASITGAQRASAPLDDDPRTRAVGARHEPAVGAGDADATVATGSEQSFDVAVELDHRRRRYP